MRHPLLLLLFSCSVVFHSLQPMDCNISRFPVHYYLPKFAQTHVHWVDNALSSSVIPFFFCPLSFLHQGLFHWVIFSHQASSYALDIWQWTKKTQPLFIYLSCIIRYQPHSHMHSYYFGYYCWIIPYLQN